MRSAAPARFSPGSTSNRRRFRTRCSMQSPASKELGHELRRPEAEYLRDDIYELRVKKGHVNYRPLYFFDDLKDPRTGRVTRRRAVIAHGCTKEANVAARDIDLAVARRN